MHKPKAVVFDLGKVLLDFDYRIVTRKLRQYCAIPEEQLLGQINQSPLLLQYEAGLCGTEHFFEEVKRHSKFCGTLEDFRPLFADIFTPIPEMVQLHRRVNEAGFPTYLFSNTNEIAMTHIRQQYPFVNRFTGEVLSYQHGAVKPQPQIYEAVEQLTAAHGFEVLYIDDRPENIAEGLRRGWQAIQHENSGATVGIVSKVLRV